MGERPAPVAVGSMEQQAAPLNSPYRCQAPCIRTPRLTPILLQGEGYLQTAAGAATLRVASALPNWARGPVAVSPFGVSSPLTVSPGADGTLSHLRSSLMNIAEARASR